jgi:hypothetical protein
MSDADDWAPLFDQLPALRFKWGLNGDSHVLTIWEVSGPGDGFPTHATYLATAWGRSIRHDRDILGHASVDDTTVYLAAYGNASVPDELTAWARQQFPEKQLETCVNRATPE